MDEWVSECVFIRLASLGGGPQVHVHMEGIVILCVCE